MKIPVLLLFLLVLLLGSSSFQKRDNSDPAKLSALLQRYYQERLALLPLESTQFGETAYNDRLYADFTDSYRLKLKRFFQQYLAAIRGFRRERLRGNDRISYDIFKNEMETLVEGLNHGYFGNFVVNPDHQYFPFSQFQGVPLLLGQLGSGGGAQPFNTVQDYENWIKRASSFPAWADSAITYFSKGIKSGVVLPRTLVVKMIPQMNAMIVDDPASSLFYTPVRNFPDGFSQADKDRLTSEFRVMITDRLVPAYKRLRDFLQTTYLPAARATSGIGALPNGKAAYRFVSRYHTTTNKTPEEIYATGLSEVKRIRTLMDSVRRAVGFSGDLPAFFTHMRTDPKFMPFKTAEEVLQAYRDIQQRIEPHLPKLFGLVPKSPFEIRQTEAFRAASASAEYNPGSADGTRPGIFYVPILDPEQYNVTSGMEGLFLHEAIPGHHFQISLQQENSALPQFRRYANYNAYAEGWGLYVESLGQELGLYTDPYQYIGALGKEIHRAIRLVVDVGMHHRGMTREWAIQYMMDNMPVNEQRATAEIERYMAMPGQALSYKIGSLRIQELRKKYSRMLGRKFSAAQFHDQFLKDGTMPLLIIEQKLDAWAASVK